MLCFLEWPLRADASTAWTWSVRASAGSVARRKLRCDVALTAQLPRAPAGTAFGAERKMEPTQKFSVARPRNHLAAERAGTAWRGANSIRQPLRQSIRLACLVRTYCNAAWKTFNSARTSRESIPVTTFAPSSP